MMIYLDHAATSHPKPQSVLDAIREWYEDFGVSASRGSGARTVEVARRVASTRRRLASMCRVPDDRLVFTSGATESLNTFLDGFLRPGDRVLTTALEHSSLIRPLVHMREERGIQFTVLSPDSEGRVEPDRIAEALDGRDHRLVAFSHASNVLGSVLDAPAICALARSAGAHTLLDASATAGLLELDVGADAVVASAHKSLLGPPGLGFLAVRQGIEVRPTRFGGTGSSHALDRQPEQWPTRLESGTPNTPAIFGLAAALDYLDDQAEGSILQRELELLDAFRAGLPATGTPYGPTTGPRIPVLSFNLEGFDPAEVGLILDGAGIHVRTGYHCAPLLHEHLGTSRGGTVRVSFGPFNRADDVPQTLRALPAS